ncbi:primosomal protein N' [Arcobacter sp. FWKO B]|nr:primosomal protein N' [Arcobacter sp. FWKO B]
MYFYEIAVLGSNLQPLTYQSTQNIPIGDIVNIKLRNKIKQGVVISTVQKPDFECLEITEITNLFLSKQMLQLGYFISSYYVSHLGISLSLFTPFDKNIEYHQPIQMIDDKIELSNSQENAYSFIKENKLALLFANTGSGKTEIYIKLIKDALEKGEQALLMMPEISLTPQMQKRLKAVFGDSVALWHSKISKIKKDKILQGLLSGEIKIIAGARSSLFLPFSNLGVIIVDEEHDDSYKSDQSPKYNAKDLAIFVGRTFDKTVVLGSATPSIGSYYKIPYIRLQETYFDTQKEFIFDESKLSINELILNKISNALTHNHQIIVFLPTRANFKYQICDTCAKAVECPYCSVSMSLHKNLKALKCHYCGYTQEIPEHCPSCKIGLIKNYRLGTAEVVQILEEKFSDKVIKRFDRDEITTETKLKTVLNEFNDGKIDILVGTQMLSKGHDYHNVKLAIVLGIDSVLSMNSYRARENALSLLLQIAGRSGRKGFGEVIIQTQNKEFFSNYMLQDDYETFLKDELEFRKELYPPFMKLAKVTFAHTNHNIAYKQMEYNIETLMKNQDIQVIGFGEEGVFKVANKYRYKIMLRSKSPKALLNALYHINSNCASIDMDTI